MQKYALNRFCVKEQISYSELLKINKTVSVNILAVYFFVNKDLRVFGIFPCLKICLPPPPIPLNLQWR